MTDAADPRAVLRGLFAAAVSRADPLICVPPHVPPPPAGRTVVVGAGKAAASMAAAVEKVWPGELSGLVITRYGHGWPCQPIEVVEAGHPMPDSAGEQAAMRVLAAVRGLGADDLLLCLWSGGGSALMAGPAPGLTLADKQAVNRALLRSGATIGEINCVRKHLSAIKGGRLALAAAPARVHALIISDVPGDDPATIASGPTVADPTTLAEAAAIVARYSIDVPAAIRARLADPAAETPKPGHPAFDRCTLDIVARPADALAAAADAARTRGLVPHILGDALEGEARELGRAHAARALALAPGSILLSGGETTVTVRGNKGRGGRNAEYLLGLLAALQGAPGIFALACDTDGIDGTEDNAGALGGPDSLARARALGWTADDALAANDAYGLFAALGDLVVTGPTRTNVNDFRAILVLPAGSR
ncbi:MAG: glycerate kinase [Proteobacteria bacterium]|nr:glycerate kinase [Pseudomonadota bacterium]